MQTKVFFSWSGDLSEKLAACFRDWLPSVLQTCQPFFSPQDIDKGNRWNPTLDVELANSQAGVIFVTPQNSQAPWLLFEAGALSNAVSRAKVCPLLFNFNSAMDLSGPLASFQATTYGYDEVLGLVKSLAALSPLSQPLGVIERTFASMWPEFDKMIQGVLSHPDHGREQAPKRNEKELLGDIARWCDSIQQQNDQLLAIVSALAQEVGRIRKPTLLSAWTSAPSSPGWISVAQVGGNSGPSSYGEPGDLPPPTSTPPPPWDGPQGPQGSPGPQSYISLAPSGPEDADIDISIQGSIPHSKAAPLWLNKKKGS